MKVLTQLTASGGIDVASSGVDNIKFGSSNTENNDATVDNLIVWANADFKNNVTLGSGVADNTIVNSATMNLSYASGARAAALTVSQITNNAMITFNGYYVSNS
jgi:hypothetical protein